MQGVAEAVPEQRLHIRSEPSIPAGRCVRIAVWTKLVQIALVHLQQIRIPDGLLVEKVVKLLCDKKGNKRGCHDRFASQTY